VAAEPRGDLADDVAGIVLAAGAGTRLRPLTTLRPKALCPVGDRALLDHALDAVGASVDALAVNVHHGRAAIEEHLERRGARTGWAAHVSVERERALGTAGAIGQLARWLDGRAAVVVNADTWHDVDLGVLLAGWDRRRPRVLTTTDGPFGPRSTVVASLVPAALAAATAAEPSGLWEVMWAPALGQGRLEVVHAPAGAVVVDCGRPGDYLAANLLWAGGVGRARPGAPGAAPPAPVAPGWQVEVVGSSVVSAGADVGHAVAEGRLERCVVWPASVVRPGEHLRDAIRAEGLTVLVR
jgi:NDP-sugar pyrophosphorylase family protein